MGKYGGYHIRSQPRLTAAIIISKIDSVAKFSYIDDNYYKYKSFIGAVMPNQTRERLERKYPPSAPCSCDVCRSFCTRPGWWTVSQAEAALRAGYGSRMMLEVSPDFTSAVLSPALRGNENDIAQQKNARNGCSFFDGGLCALFGTGHQPLECRFCHHERPGLGPRCHEGYRARLGHAARPHARHALGRGKRAVAAVRNGMNMATYPPV